MDLINIPATQRFNNLIENFFNNNFSNTIHQDINIIPGNTYIPIQNIMSRNVEDIMNESIIPNLIQEQIYMQALDRSLSEEQDSHNKKNPNQILNIDFKSYTGKEGVDCSICTENFKNEDQVSNMECKHLFHKDCIIEWGKYKNTCPICREILPLK